jgi:hypothetical protein
VGGPPIYTASPKDARPIRFAERANANKAAAATSNTRASDTAGQTSGESVPIALANAGEYGENVYDYAKANDWKNAEDKLAALTVAANQVPTMSTRARQKSVSTRMSWHLGAPLPRKIARRRCAQPIK